VAHPSNGVRLLLRSCALLAVLTTPLHAEEEFSYLFEIPTRLSPDASGELGDYIQATLDIANTDDAVALIESEGAIDIIAVDGSQITVLVAAQATTVPVYDENDLAQSFVIDYDEDSVMTTTSLLRDSFGASPAPGAIEQFVYEYIDDKNYLSGFDFASKVARTRAGDCTEHAVLMAALSRAEQYPARVVLGILLEITGDEVSGYGHAWTELFHNGRWQLYDATVPADLESDAQYYYLPMMSLNNEGPGYGMELLRLSVVEPTLISGIQAAQAPNLSP